MAIITGKYKHPEEEHDWEGYNTGRIIPTYHIVLKTEDRKLHDIEDASLYHSVKIGQKVTLLIEKKKCKFLWFRWVEEHKEILLK